VTSARADPSGNEKMNDRENDGEWDSVDDEGVGYDCACTEMLFKVIVQLL
jgi:squalene cyclase